MLFLKYIKMNLMSAMEYKLAFTLTMIGRIISVFLEMFALFFMFDRFNSLLNYSFGEVGICYLIVRLSYSTANCFGKGFDRLARTIRKGVFDSFLIRPRSKILQVFGSDLDPNDIGIVIQYILMLIFFINSLDIVWNVYKVLTILFMVISGIVIFFGIIILFSAICFYTVSGLEIVNIFTKGGVEVASYPLVIYNKWITRFFTFIIPFGFINYLPLFYITDRVTGNTWLYMLSPLIGILFIFPCIWIWNRAARHYTSTGS